MSKSLNKFSYLLIVIGLSFTMLVLYFAFSSVKDAVERVEDLRGGDLADYEIMSILKTMPATQLVDLVEKLSKHHELKMLSSNIQTESFLSKVVLQYGYQKTGYHVPILKGRYFKQEELATGQKVALIPKEIEKEQFAGNAIGKKLTIFQQDYEIVGVYGREKRETPGGQYAFIPMKSVPKWENEVIRQLSAKDDSFTISVYRYKGESGDILQACKDALGANKAAFVTKPDINTSILTNTKLLALIFGGSFFIIAGLNLRNLQYYRVLFRKKELAVKYALGSPTLSLLWDIIRENLVITLVSSILAIAMQKLVISVISDKIDIASTPLQYYLLICLSSFLLCAFISLMSLRKVFSSNLMTILGGDT